MNELEKNRDVILFIDELHTIVGAGGASGSLDASDPTFGRPNFGSPPTTVNGGTYYYDTFDFTVSTTE